MSNRLAVRKREVRHIRCPKCGSEHISATTMSIGFAKCNDCGYSKSALAIKSKGSGADSLDSLIGGLVALGLIAIGAAIVGAVLTSLATPQKREELPEYDEERWKPLFR